MAEFWYVIIILCRAARMDWSARLGIIGVGTALLFGFLPFVVKDVPVWISWPGLALGVVLVVVAVATNHDFLQAGPLTLYVVGMLFMIGAIAWGYSSNVKIRPSLSASFSVSPAPTNSTPIIDIANYARKQCFDYSTNNGTVNVQQGQMAFELHFSKREGSSIYLYREGTNIDAIARVPNMASGSPLDFSKFDSSSRFYSIATNEHFILKNNKGEFLQGKILSVRDDSRGDPNDEVCFAYEFDQIGKGQFISL